MLKLVEDVTVVIPSIPVRQNRLIKALDSVHAQTVQVANTVVQVDHARAGAAVNRDAGLAQSESEWTAFLDDDDILYPEHIQLLLRCARETDADLVYPWFDVIGGTDPFPQFEGQPWDSEHPHQVPITFLVKTDLAKAVGGFSGGWTDEGALDPYGNRIGEDLHFIYKFVAAGHKIVHLPRRTWGWVHWHGNTSGLPSRW